MRGTDIPIPITLVTGFLGSGKTTILAHVLGHDSFERTCAIINEFGDIGLDHELIEASDDDVILLAKGCLCCTIRGSLADTLRDILKRRSQGRLGPIDRVVVETTGLADPFPVLQMLSNDPVVAARYRLAGVIAVVDTEQGQSILAERIEAVRQVLVADRIVLTKADLSGPQTVDDLKRYISSLNHSADIAIAIHGFVTPSFVFDERRVAGVASSPIDPSPSIEAATGVEPHLDVETFVIGFDASLSQPHVSSIMKALERLAGPRLWRVKGLLWTDDERPLLVNVVGSRVYPPHALDRMPSDARVSRLIFIVAPDLRSGIETSFAKLGGHYATGNAFAPS